MELVARGSVKSMGSTPSSFCTKMFYFFNICKALNIMISFLFKKKTGFHYRCNSFFPFLIVVLILRTICIRSRRGRPSTKKIHNFVKKRKVVTCDTTCDPWHVTHDRWHVTCDTWHMTQDTSHVVGGEHSLKISAP